MSSAGVEQRYGGDAAQRRQEADLHPRAVSQGEQVLGVPRNARLDQLDRLTLGGQGVGDEHAGVLSGRARQTPEQGERQRTVDPQCRLVQEGYPVTQPCPVHLGHRSCPGTIAGGFDSLDLQYRHGSQRRVGGGQSAEPFERGHFALA